jgi:hypothetical protein
MKPTHRYDTKAYHDYYIHQVRKGYPVFVGRRYQRGHVLGSIFGGLFKAAMPLLKKGAKTLGREALKTGLNIAGDVVQGRNIKQAAQSRLKSTGQNLLQKAKRVLQRYCQVHVLFDIFSPQIPDIIFRLGVCNNRGKLSYRNDELVSF